MMLRHVETCRFCYQPYSLFTTSVITFIPISQHLTKRFHLDMSRMQPLSPYEDHQFQESLPDCHIYEDADVDEDACSMHILNVPLWFTLETFYAAVLLRSLSWQLRLCQIQLKDVILKGKCNLSHCTHTSSESIVCNKKEMNAWWISLSLLPGKF